MNLAVSIARGRMGLGRVASFGNRQNLPPDGDALISIRHSGRAEDTT
jgi:hypothetical protein